MLSTGRQGLDTLPACFMSSRIPPAMRQIFFLLVIFLITPAHAQDHAFEELYRFQSQDARQAPAVDAAHVYVISNYSISKHHKTTGELVMRWEGEEYKPFIHLNSGIVLNDTLFAAHSNYPVIPMASSIEMFDPETLQHIGSHSFGIGYGSATWIDRKDGNWWVGFANYEGRGGVPGKGPAWTNIVVFDAQWRRVGGYTFPQAVIDRFLDRSNSGAAFGPKGYLYATGHDAPEVYVLKLPEAGTILELVAIVPVAAEGQGIAWDPSDPEILYTLIKKDRSVIASRFKQ